MSLTKEEKENYHKFSKYFGKNIVITLIDGDKLSGKLETIENPLDVEPEYPMFIIRETPETPYLTGIYLNEIKEISLV